MLPPPCTLSVHLATSPFMSFPFQSKTHSHKHTLTHTAAICFLLVSLTPTFWFPLCTGINLFKSQCSCILEHCTRSKCLGVYPFELWLCSYGFCVSQLVAAYMRVCLSVCLHTSYTSSSVCHELVSMCPEYACGCCAGMCMCAGSW